MYTLPWQSPFVGNPQLARTTLVTPLLALPFNEPGQDQGKSN